MTSFMIQYLDVFDFFGIVGAVSLVGNYALLQWRRNYDRTPQYSLLNAIAAILMGVYLSRNFDPALSFMNVAWLLVSLYGIYRCMKYERRHKKKHG